MWDTIRLPDPEIRDSYYDAGWWRHRTFLDDLREHADANPDHPAIIAYEAGALARTLTYAQLADTVERLAAGLARHGIQPRDVVVLYLPNRWMLTPLYLACARIGAVASPVIPVLGGRELQHVLVDSRAKMCVTTEAFAERLIEVAPPTLRHQIIVGHSSFDALLSSTNKKTEA